MVATVSRGLVDGPGPGVEAHVNRAVEGDRGEMTVSTAHVERGRWKLVCLEELRFYGPQHGTEVRQFTEVKPEEVFISHVFNRSIR